MPKKTTDKRITALVLAAGKSTRVKQDLPKVITPLGGRPLIFHLLDTLVSLKRYVKETVVVLGHQKEIIEPVIKKEFPQVSFAYQKKMNGTAKAVAAGVPHASEPDTLILCADAPLITAETLKKFIASYFRQDKDGSLITSILDKDNDFGRIERDSSENVIRIIEKKDLGKRDLPEVNSGIYLLKTELLGKGLKKIKMNQKKKEYYFTDIIEIFSRSGLSISAFNLKSWSEMIGINDQQALAKAYKLLNCRYLEEKMTAGVRIIDPDTTFLSHNVKIGRNSVIYPFTFIENNVIIGNNCHVGPFVHLRANTVLRDDVYIGVRSGGNGENPLSAPFALGK